MRKKTTLRDLITLSVLQKQTNKLETILKRILIMYSGSKQDRVYRHYS